MISMKNSKRAAKATRERVVWPDCAVSGDGALRRRGADNLGICGDDLREWQRSDGPPSKRCCYVAAAPEPRHPDLFDVAGQVIRYACFFATRSADLREMTDLADVLLLPAIRR